MRRLVDTTFYEGPKTGIDQRNSISRPISAAFGKDSFGRSLRDQQPQASRTRRLSVPESCLHAQRLSPIVHVHRAWPWHIADYSPARRYSAPARYGCGCCRRRPHPTRRPMQCEPCRLPSRRHPEKCQGSFLRMRSAALIIAGLDAALGIFIVCDLLFFSASDQATRGFDFAAVWSRALTS